MSELALSVLDLIPVRTGQTSADAVAATVALAERADALGYRRYWLGEHHNMRSVAATNPPVLIGLLTGRTRRMRLGSGGIMLPNYDPFVVAEQFAALEAAAPGRIDIGIGRAPGSDPVITALLRSEGHTSDVEHHPSHIGDIQALVSPSGAAVRLGSGGTQAVRATPAAASSPEFWLLGSSDYSAELAGRMGLPYAFAHHFSGKDTERLLDLYRSRFTASEHLAEPRALITANAVVADDAEEAMRLALPQFHYMSQLLTGAPLDVFTTVEGAARARMTAEQQGIVDEALGNAFIGEADEVAEGLTALARRTGVDELMLIPAATGRDADPADRAPGRERTLELLAARLLQRESVAA